MKIIFKCFINFEVLYTSIHYNDYTMKTAAQAAMKKHQRRQEGHWVPRSSGFYTFFSLCGLGRVV